MLNSPNLWFLDAAESMIFAFLLGVYGIKVIIENTGHRGSGKKVTEIDFVDRSSCRRDYGSVDEKSQIFVSDTCTYTTFPHSRINA